MAADARCRSPPRFKPAPTAGILDEDAPHGLRGGVVEVLAVLESAPVAAPLADEPQVGIVDERRRLQGVALPLAGHLLVSDRVEMLVDDRDELVHGRGLAFGRGVEEAGDEVGRIVGWHMTSVSGSCVWSKKKAAGSR